jgi:hypothetical protein
MSPNIIEFTGTSDLAKQLNYLAKLSIQCSESLSDIISHSIQTYLY